MLDDCPLQNNLYCRRWHFIQTDKLVDMVTVVLVVAVVVVVIVAKDDEDDDDVAAMGMLISSLSAG